MQDLFSNTQHRAQIVYTDSESDEQPVQQPASTAASQQQHLNVAAPQPTQEITTTTSRQPRLPTCEGSSVMPIVISSDSDSDIELLV